VSTRIIVTAGLLSISLLAGCASHSAYQAPAYRTGSLIPVPASEQTKQGTDEMQSVSQDQLRATGYINLRTALKTLVPQAH
jgi:hypothetical protein